ncbi:YifB family Mg chelatase-like AAA ATPase [Microbacterium sp. STN6]|uniref:YifB family Mg chelatase-like AAA ATPase n=1 Tax=Microbacterium sp. STN6 TaxID=2995588 RepID=UPI002260DA3E|nr:YifB family Mg chelatase-like AAA ATPase [Microbacterium sp. STN6]MCX7522127.1 YifB family Mg chelatase-like AAA ATPase [Microbacterium sp. STN6]
MAIGRTFAVALHGLAGSLVEVEADIANGLPAFVLIGLPDTALAEARDRVRAAAVNSGCPITGRKLTVNLSPAALPKHGSGFDLAIAMASLAASGDVPAESVHRVVHIGELGLDGRLRPTLGVLPAVLGAERAGFRTVMVPTANAQEAELVSGVRVVPVDSLRDAAVWHGGELEPARPDEVSHVTHDAPEPAADSRDDGADPNHVDADLHDIVGNDDAVQALLVAAAGGHHLFMLGPPGAGKTMLASRLPGILPDLDTEAALEVTSMRSLTGRQIGARLSRRPPFETPHHTASAAAMIGGGSGQIRPGAAARAAHGVLFLDEAPEFAAAVLDSLRQPLESGQITIHRANAVASFPGRFQLVLAANPCPCGQYGAPDSECTCPPSVRRRYLGRLSGPLLDRIDIQLRLRRVTAVQLRLADEEGRLTSEEARARVVAARALAGERLSGTPWSLNSQVSGPWLRERKRRLGHVTTASLDRALERGGITMRGYDRVLRLAWTLSDLDGVERPGSEHIGAALYLRRGIT